MRLRTILIGTVVVVVGLGVAAVAIVSNMDFSQYKGLIAQKTKDATGRDLNIRGDLKVVIGLSPSLAVSDVSFANSPWGSRPQMVEVKRFEAQVDLLPLITGNIRVKRLVLIQPDILLETNAQGRGNWEFDTAGAAPSPSAPGDKSAGAVNLPQVNEVEIRDAKLVHRDGRSGEVMNLTLARALLRADSETAPLKLDIDGAYNSLRFQVAGLVGSVAALGSPGTAFPVNVTARLADAATLKVDGQIREPLAGKGYDLRIGAEAAEIARLAEIAGVKLPALGPLKADLRLNDSAPGGKPSLPQVKAEAGKPELIVLKVEGSVRDVIGQKGVALDLTAEGREVGAFSGLALPGAAPLPEIPALGPFKLTAKTGNGPGDRLALPNVKLELGRDDLLKLTVDGAIQDPLARKGFALNIAANARDLAAVAKTLKTDVPLEGPLSLRGRIADAGPDRYALSNLKLEAAGSDVGGEASLSLAGAKPTLTANLASTLVDLSKLIPKKDKGAAPASGGRPAGGSGASSGARSGDDGRVFSADPLPLDGLSAVDAELRYRAETIRGGGVPPLRSVALQTNLRGGDLAVRPLTADLGGGKISGEVTLAGATGAFSAKLSAKGVEMGAIDQDMVGQEVMSGGKTDIDIDLKGTGKSVRALMASLDGNIFVHVGQGQVKGNFTDAIGLGELAALIDKSMPKQDTTPLNCVVTKLDIKQGIATSQGFVVDSARMTLDGSGKVDLRDERPDLLFNSHTKVPNLLSILPPIRVGGTLANPRFLPDVGAAATGLVGDVLGTVLGSPGAIVGTLTGQRRQQADICAQALARATGRQPAPQTGQGQPGQIAPQPSQQPSQQQQQQPANPIDEIGRGIRGIFGR